MYCIVLYCIVLYCIVLYITTTQPTRQQIGRISLTSTVPPTLRIPLGLYFCHSIRHEWFPTRTLDLSPNVVSPCYQSNTQNYSLPYAKCLQQTTNFNNLAFTAAAKSSSLGSDTFLIGATRYLRIIWVIYNVFIKLSITAIENLKFEIYFHNRIFDFLRRLFAKHQTLSS